jgi:flagellar motility protein MotE (MotC chaperone)
MKTILIVSTLTFLVLFGTIVMTSGMLENAVKGRLGELLAPVTGGDGEDLDETLGRLALERDALQRQREELALRVSAMDVEQKAFDEAQARLQALATEIKAAQGSLDAAHDVEIAKLAKVYEAMKPASAAPILASLDMDIVLEIMSRLKDRQAARILAFMTPALAAEISARMSPQGGSS